eukprot:Blabericola_migrator_1__5228@NODE_2690_length_2457_cov_46_332636_g1682_i0_p1_GENE_NODE_2690_length_2457_cov_46_332636_g1682_i0NODE_2690_length_2457_cov_46_332636_g1682_i0_p1_ORF_typecomplete_len196_score16_84_NODE_2690_length_2457_cov_46_332636_g1682_i012481835
MVRLLLTMLTVNEITMQVTALLAFLCRAIGSLLLRSTFGATSSHLRLPSDAAPRLQTLWIPVLVLTGVFLSTFLSSPAPIPKVALMKDPWPLPFPNQPPAIASPHRKAKVVRFSDLPDIRIFRKNPAEEEPTLMVITPTEPQPRVRRPPILTLYRRCRKGGSPVVSAEALSKARERYPVMIYDHGRLIRVCFVFD